MVPPGDDEEADETLVSVDDKVSSHLLCFFVVEDELRGREALEVAASRLGIAGMSAASSKAGGERTLTIMGRCPRSRVMECEGPPLRDQEMVAVMREA